MHAPQSQVVSTQHIKLDPCGCFEVTEIKTMLDGPDKVEKEAELKEVRRKLTNRGGGVRKGSGPKGKNGFSIKSLTEEDAERVGLCWGYCRCSSPRRGVVTGPSKKSLQALTCSEIYKKRNQCGYCKTDFQLTPP